MTRWRAPGASNGVKLRECGELNPHGAENSALKNTAPRNATPPRISENGSISFLYSLQKSQDLRQNDPCPLDSESISTDARAWCVWRTPRTILIGKQNTLQRTAKRIGGHTMRSAYGYQETLETSERIGWRVEDIIGPDKRLNFKRPFLPDSLARVDSLEFLTREEKLL